MSAKRPPVPPVVLTFAGSDPTSGAGLQADLLTIGGMGCHGVSAVTAITVQDTAGVSQVVPVPADLVDAQARAILADMPVAAIKIGAVASAGNAGVIAALLRDHPDLPVILDPVLASGRGDPLGGDEVCQALREHLIPLATVVTPNSVEARRLAVPDADDAADLADCARSITALGAKHVLVTGTHEPTRMVINTLYDAGGVLRSDRWRRLPGDYHGSGCTLASSIAAALANGLELEDAVREGQEFTWHALRAGFVPGQAQAIPDRYFWARSGTGNDREPDEPSDDADARTDRPRDKQASNAPADHGEPVADRSGPDVCATPAQYATLEQRAAPDPGAEPDAGANPESVVSLPPFPFPTTANPPVPANA